MTASLSVIAVVAGVVGLAIGSFLNVVIHRVPAGRSVIRGASACPACGHPIRARDNVPVLSWLRLRGRCRDCGARVSVQYPLVEAATAAAFVLVALGFAPGGLLAGSSSTVAQSLVLVAMLWFAAATIALAVIDVRLRRLPDRIVLPTILALAVLLGAAAVVAGEPAVIGRALLGGVLSFAGYLLLALVTRGGMGMGDVKLSAALGIATGWFAWSSLVLGVLAAFCLGGIAGIVLLVTRRAGRRSMTAFGPWMLAGAWIGILAGPPVWDWYRAILGLP